MPPIESSPIMALRSSTGDQYEPLKKIGTILVLETGASEEQILLFP